MRFGNVISCSDYRGTRDGAIYLSTFWQRRERVVWRDVGNSIFDVGSFLCINRDDIFSIISVRKRRVDGCGRSDEQHSFTNLQKSVRKLVKASFKLVKIKATLDGNYEKDPFTGSFSSFHLWQNKGGKCSVKIATIGFEPGSSVSNCAKAASQIVIEVRKIFFNRLGQIRELLWVIFWRGRKTFWNQPRPLPLILSYFYFHNLMTNARTIN